MCSCHTRVADAIHTSITHQLAALGEQAKLQPLSWSVQPERPGTVSGYAEHGEHENGDVLTAWSHLLGLTWQDATTPGTWRYTGRVGVLLVDIWGVTDRDLFDKHARGE